jgi:hypothetical protein
VIETEAKVLVLSCAPEGNYKSLFPLNYPVTPGAEVWLPPPDVVRRILTGDEDVHRLKLGHVVTLPPFFIHSELESGGR